ncbi:MAG: DUF4926 domain-containing protein [Desulfosporosinus sp.]|nr:DUF4926 domain-containing protein [Desulfosporosinus sp.]
MKEYDEVELLKDLPEERLVKGQKGYILEIYNEQYCEVEFSDLNGTTVYLGALPIEILKIVDKK